MPKHPGKRKRRGAVKKTSFSEQLKSERGKKAKPTSMKKFKQSLRERFGFDKKKK